MERLEKEYFASFKKAEPPKVSKASVISGASVIPEAGEENHTLQAQGSVMTDGEALLADKSAIDKLSMQAQDSRAKTDDKFDHLKLARPSYETEGLEQLPSSYAGDDLSHIAKAPKSICEAETSRFNTELKTTQVSESKQLKKVKNNLGELQEIPQSSIEDGDS